MKVRLTEVGKGIALRLAEARRVKFTRVLAAISDEERVSVMQALRVLEEAMSKDGYARGGIVAREAKYHANTSGAGA